MRTFGNRIRLRGGFWNVRTLPYKGIDNGIPVLQVGHSEVRWWDSGEPVPSLCYCALVSLLKVS